MGTASFGPLASVACNFRFVERIRYGYGTVYETTIPCLGIVGRIIRQNTQASTAAMNIKEALKVPVLSATKPGIPNKEIRRRGRRIEGGGNKKNKEKKSN